MLEVGSAWPRPRRIAPGAGILRSFPLLALCLLASPARGDCNHYGVIALHDANLLLSATDGSLSMCLSGTSPATCDQIDTRVDGAHDLPTAVLFKVYAVFPAGWEHRLTGLSWGIHYPSTFHVIGYGMCGDFELNDADWPASDTGSSVVWNTARTAPITPVYWFAGYNDGPPCTFDLRDHPSYGGWWGDDCIGGILDPIMAYGKLGFDMDGEDLCYDSMLGACCAQVECAFVPPGGCPYYFQWSPNEPCDPNPCTEVFGACCYPGGRCELVPSNCSGYYLGYGTSCDPNPCAELAGACCYEDGHCEVMEPFGCPHYWQFEGPGTVCEPNPCPQPIAACCRLDGSCEMLTEAECPPPSLWYADWDCLPVPCPAQGACCLDDGNCIVDSQVLCELLAGQWLGEGTACTPNPCLPTPTLKTTWGGIKVRYR